MSNEALYGLLEESVNQLLALRAKYPFCSVCKDTTKPLFIYCSMDRNHSYAQWVCAQCYELLTGEDIYGKFQI